MNYAVKNRTNRKAPKKRPLMFYGTSALAVIVIALGILQLTHIIHLFGKTPLSGVIPTTSVHNNKSKNTPPASTQTKTPATPGATSTTNSKGEGSSTSTPTSTTPTALVTPWGSFVSNHSPGQDSSPTTEVSVCNTSPGATCYIKFVNGSYNRTLPVQTADSQGTVTWNWDTSSPALPSGSWQITAVATLNGQTKTTQDSRALVIQ